MDQLCDNCRESVQNDSEALVVIHKGNVVANICSTCQQAKKIRITLERVDDAWGFYQYTPVEA